MTTTEKTTVTEVNIKMRIGVSQDFRIEVLQVNQDGQLVPVLQPKYGQPYWLKSDKTGVFDNRNYQISEETDWVEFKTFLRLEMVYIPLGYFELKDLGAL